MLTLCEAHNLKIPLFLVFYCVWFTPWWILPFFGKSSLLVYALHVVQSLPNLPTAVLIVCGPHHMEFWYFLPLHCMCLIHCNIPLLTLHAIPTKQNHFSALLTLQKGSYLAGILLLLFHIAREIDAVESLFCCIYMNFGYIIQNLNFAVFP